MTKIFLLKYNLLADCKVHWLKKFLYKEMLGFTKNNELFSCMAREKMIMMEEALTRLREANKLQSMT